MALEVEAFGSGGWSEAAWQEELDRAGQGVHIACLPDGRPAGVIALTAVFETADLLRVMVAPTVRCQGLGRTLVEAGLIWARERGAERLLLEVAATNAPARHLYSRLGFTTIDRRRDYYGAGTDALIMSRNCEEDRRV
jgi:ribosomal protein S18 acetylase RimI-like enzyme